MRQNSQNNREVYLEFQTAGNSQKVTAIDPVSLLEACVIGPTNISRDHITQLALKKLQRRIDREAGV